MKALLLLWLSAWYGNLTTTYYVDSIEPLLAQNRDTYLSGAHTAERQKTALAYFDQQWAWLQSQEACGNRLLGKAGQACLGDRALSGRYSWERSYRDPISTGHF